MLNVIRSAMTTIKKTRKKTVTPMLLETYLLFEKPKTLELGNNINNIFKKLKNIDDHLENCLVFLNQQNALQYSRFTQENAFIVKAYIPHIAIIGKAHGLSLKKGMITHNHIHGLYTNPHKNKRYVVNPHFDEQHFTQPANDECLDAARQ